MAVNGRTRELAARHPIFAELEEMRSELRDLVRDMWEGRWRPLRWARWPAAPELPVDMFEREGNIIVKAEMAGINPGDIEVTISDDELRISGERKEEKEVKEEQYYRSERSYGHIFRLLTLPPGCDTAAVQATVKDGVLEVVIPRKPQAAARKIEVKVQPSLAPS